MIQRVTYNTIRPQQQISFGATNQNKKCAEEIVAALFSAIKKSSTESANLTSDSIQLNVMPQDSEFGVIITRNTFKACEGVARTIAANHNLSEVAQVLKDQKQVLDIMLGIARKS